MLGAHLDSVADGPGINDNGSGTAGILETALSMANAPTRNRLRFAFWGAEELGLLGSEHYVAGLPAAEKAKIKLYLNFDMIASPNHIIGIYDGDDSDATGAPAGPPGSDQIEKFFEKYFTAAPACRTVGTDFNGRSDYGPFIAVGHPLGRPVHRRRGHQDRRGGRRSSAARPGSPTTCATTRRATPSPTSTTGRWRRTPARSRRRRSPTPAAATCPAVTPRAVSAPVLPVLPGLGGGAAGLGADHDHTLVSR